MIYKQFFIYQKANQILTSFNQVLKFVSLNRSLVDFQILFNFTFFHTINNT